MHWLGANWTEILGFATGAACVWLTVKVNIWNWPLGLANNAFSLVLFIQSRLFADSALQVVYLVLGVLGWYWWLHGAEERAPLPISRTPGWAWVGMGILAVPGTWAMAVVLVHIRDSAPFWDALTTVASLLAQYMLCKKWIENWWVWIAADLVYIPLYLVKHIPLFSVLYALFLGLCVVGLLAWRRERSGSVPPPTAGQVVGEPQGPGLALG